MKNFLLSHKKTGIIFFILGVLGIGVIVFYMIMWPHFRNYASNQISGINYLAYFTFLANISISMWLLLAGVSIILKLERLKKILVSPKIFCGVILYALITGLVYYGAIRWIITPFPWYLWWARLSDAFFHAITPIVALLLFVYMKIIHNNTNHVPLKHRHIFLWLVFPLAYFVFSMIRGHLADWFPYPFFDMNWEFIITLGIPSWLYIFLLVVLFLALFYLIGFVIMKIWNKICNEFTS